MSEHEGTFSPTTKNFSGLNSPSESRAGPPLTIMIGLAVVAGIGLIIAIFLFAGNPEGLPDAGQALSALSLLG